MRRHSQYPGKPGTHTLNYGMQVRKLALTLDISAEEAEALMAKYMATYPAVGRFFEGTQAFLSEKLFVTSMLGRYRTLPEVRSPNKFEAWRAGRQAANFQIQGSAAECAKMAMVRLYEEGFHRLGWFILAQIHDEIITEGPEETAKEAAAMLKACMEDPFASLGFRMSTPLKADPTIADTWYEAK